MKKSKDTLFKVEWNSQIYGEVNNLIVTLHDFIKDGINGDWGIEENGEFTLRHLIELDVDDSLKVYSPNGWDIQITRIK